MRRYEEMIRNTMVYIRIIFGIIWRDECMRKGGGGERGPHQEEEDDETTGIEYETH